MQVFGDSQIKLHSKIDNEKAIELVSQKAKANNIPLVIKPHPAEFDINALHTVIKLKEQYNFYISSENTFSLIMKSKMVTVINSTVGLEAILCGKDVDFLGDSFYQYFQDDDFLRYYINDWLIEYDIFCTNKIYLTDEQFNKFLSRADATVIV